MQIDFVMRVLAATLVSACFSVMNAQGARASCAAWDVSGTWQFDSPRGNFVITLTQSGGAISGTSGTNGRIEGTISGNTTRLQSSAPGAPGRIYEGTIEPDGTWSGLFWSPDSPQEQWEWLGMRRAACLLEGPPAAPGPQLPPMEYDIDRAGSDIARSILVQSDPAICQQKCMEAQGCRAWTMVKPGVQDVRSICYLKNAVPPATPNDCCISGVR